MLIENETLIEAWGDVEKKYRCLGVLKDKMYQGNKVLSGVLEFPSNKFWMNVYLSDGERTKSDYNVTFTDFESKEKVGKASGFDNGYYTKVMGKIGESDIEMIVVRFKKKDMTFYWRVYVLVESKNTVADDEDDVPFEVKDAPKTKLGKDESNSQDGINF
jgi:hypothetical protein